ncbi:MAG: secondary thiamine-phosphate synthase enzyme YjbQ [Candidatus Marinimicrobia bacterium]|nr:secondary thiamine-phosphate synthase enzyme YjbQ [Candidatus Neomarinimicrobiota bacterium]MCF7829215.1 secondary thiamine-phosphate synthase enzyme YjbQ [Candidatus Neomarinimicrobiota bacterium]MCF7881132.1 secondary thiamine-phosphate synthase enzyme YjbQ [Candidatus Neomarinimicrobiota bacterium]
MDIFTEYIHVSSKREIDISDISDDVQRLVRKNDISQGQVTVFCPGSTGGITTIEHEPGLLQDIPEVWEQIAPAEKTYHHNETWHDGNGHSHIRAAMTKPDLTVPIIDGELALGTWQQIVFIDFDVPARERKLIVQIIGK